MRMQLNDKVIIIRGACQWQATDRTPQERPYQATPKPTV